MWRQFLSMFHQLLEHSAAVCMQPTKWGLTLKVGAQAHHIAAQTNVFPTERSIREVKMFTSIPLSCRLHRWEDFIPGFQVGHFLALGSASASADCMLPECGNCFQTKYGSCQMFPSLLWVTRFRYSDSLHYDSVLPFLCGYSLFCLFFFNFTHIFPLIIACMPMYCCKVYLCLRGWRVIVMESWAPAMEANPMQEWAGSLGWGVRAAPAMPMLLLFLLASSQPPALRSEKGYFWPFLTLSPHMARE